MMYWWYWWKSGRVIWTQPDIKSNERTRRLLLCLRRVRYKSNKIKSLRSYWQLIEIHFHKMILENL